VILDEDQQKVVDLNDGHYAILAGAGSGKSTVLLHRTARLYMADPTRKILCVTFTSEAAKNLRNRIAKQFFGVELSIFSTLHALALKFAINHPEAFPFHLSENPLADESLSARAVFDAIGDKISFKAFTSWVSLQKRNRVSAIDAVQKAERTGQKLDYAIGYKRYQSLLKKQGILDFDDLIYYMVEILESDKDLRRLWQYDYVMQDEAQDACELDWVLLQLLTERRNNLLCVGDSGQALYGFRGGAAHHLLNMDDMFPGTRTLMLGRNYRSLPEIVEAGKKAYPYPSIAQNFKAVRDGLATVSVLPYATLFREAEQVISMAKLYKAEETAVLSRTNLALRAIEEECLNQNLQYHILGDSGFWESPEVENILHYLRAMVFRTDASIQSAIRTPFWPTKYVKKKQVVEKVKSYIQKGLKATECLWMIPELTEFNNTLTNLSSHIRHLNAQGWVESTIKHLKAIEHYAGEDNVSPDRNPVANLKELVRAASKHGSIGEFLDFVRRLSYARQQRKGVCLSTIHQAKGKEWKNVFLISVNENVLPHIKSNDIEEEKCCFFVGVSRAEDNLHISFYDTPSRFLEPFIEIKNEEQTQRLLSDTPS